MDLNALRNFAQGASGVGTGTSNYVVFQGEENALSILARNGVAP